MTQIKRCKSAYIHLVKLPAKLHGAPPCAVCCALAGVEQALREAWLAQESADETLDDSPTTRALNVWARDKLARVASVLMDEPPAPSSPSRPAAP